MIAPESSKGAHMSTFTRRDLVRLGAIVAAATTVRGVASPQPRMPGPADSGWPVRSHRWIQVAFTEDDPGNYDPEFWLRYFQEIRAQGACLSAGGAIAFYPTDVPFHHRGSIWGLTTASGRWCGVAVGSGWRSS